jgi:hypothetical protein
MFHVVVVVDDKEKTKFHDENVQQMLKDMREREREKGKKSN